MSSEAIRIAGPDLLDTITEADLLSDLRAVAEGGWLILDDTVLLRRWYASYHGDRGHRNAIDYEIAVNGRGVPDFDIADSGEACVPLLLRRGAAFAWSALHKAHHELPEVRLAAYISVSPMLVDIDPLRFDTDHHTGTMTFCALGPDRRLHIDPAQATDCVVAIFSEDCAEPLPR
ncbi:hypothetical protein OG203_28315 [Nocardia sp. NBC_01499]|uniref:hypothetical protein n=1 Tax=Nocardia sp. NBC_01499 TaxID=2903597 RepID=UPI00386D268F